MLQVNSITLQGADNRQIHLRRYQNGQVAVVAPIIDQLICIIKPTDLQDEILGRILPILYGEPNLFGEFDCTGGDIQQVIREIERLF